MQENLDEEIQEIKRQIKEEKIKNIYLNFIDFNGNMRSKLVGVKELINNTHVSWNDGISINGRLIKDFENDFEADWLVLLPDPKSFRIIPFLEEEQKSAMLMCEIKNFSLDSRNLLKKVVEEFKSEENLEPIVGSEFIYEFINSSQDYYYALPTSNSTKFNNLLANYLLESKIDIEYYMPYGKSYNRIDLVPDVAINSADKLAISKWFLESLALKQEVKVKLSQIKNENISSCPIHISLWNKNREKNLFFDENDTLELSNLGRKFINGILYYHKYICAVIKSKAKQEMPKLIPKLSTRKR